MLERCCNGRRLVNWLELIHGAISWFSLTFRTISHSCGVPASLSTRDDHLFFGDGSRTADVTVFKIYVGIDAASGMITVPVVILVGIFGVLAAWKAGYSLDDGWLIAAYVTTVTALIVPGVTFKLRGDGVAKLMDQEIEEGASFLNNWRYSPARSTELSKHSCTC